MCRGMRGMFGILVMYDGVVHGCLGDLVVDRDTARGSGRDE